MTNTVQLEIVNFVFIEGGKCELSVKSSPSSNCNVGVDWSLSRRSDRVLHRPENRAQSPKHYNTASATNWQSTARSARRRN